jgi:hypothetical protein
VEEYQYLPNGSKTKTVTYPTKGDVPGPVAVYKTRPGEDKEHLVRITFSNGYEEEYETGPGEDEERLVRVTFSDGQVEEYNRRKKIRVKPPSTRTRSGGRLRPPDSLHPPPRRCG